MHVPKVSTINSSRLLLILRMVGRSGRMSSALRPTFGLWAILGAWAVDEAGTFGENPTRVGVAMFVKRVVVWETEVFVCASFAASVAEWCRGN